MVCLNLAHGVDLTTRAWQKADGRIARDDLAERGSSRWSRLVACRRRPDRTRSGGPHGEDYRVPLDSAHRTKLLSFACGESRFGDLVRADARKLSAHACQGGLSRSPHHISTRQVTHLRPQKRLKASTRMAEEPSASIQMHGRQEEQGRQLKRGTQTYTHY